MAPEEAHKNNLSLVLQHIQVLRLTNDDDGICYDVRDLEPKVGRGVQIGVLRKIEKMQSITIHPKEYWLGMEGQIGGWGPFPIQGMPQENEIYIIDIQPKFDEIYATCMHTNNGGLGRREERPRFEKGTGVLSFAGGDLRFQPNSNACKLLALLWDGRKVGNKSPSVVKKNETVIGSCLKSSVKYVNRRLKSNKIPATIKSGRDGYWLEIRPKSDIN